MDFNLDFDFGFEKKETPQSAFKKIPFETINFKPKKTKIAYSNAAELAFDIEIQKGEMYSVNLTGDFVFGDFIGAFIQENNLDVQELSVISLSGGLENFEMLEALIEKGWVEKVNLMLSGFFMRTEEKKHLYSLKNNSKNKTTKKSIAEYFNELKTNHKDNFNIFASEIHSKVTLIKTKQGGHVTMVGSANLRSSQSFENLFIIENKEMYDFNYNYHFIELLKFKKNGKK